MTSKWWRWFGSRVERRVYITLLLMAVLPIAVAALWSFGTVREELQASSYRDLRDYAKTYGIAVWDRLQQLDLSLMQVERVSSEGQDHGLGEDVLRRQFAWVALVDANGEVFQEYIRDIPTPSRVELPSHNRTLVQLLTQGVRHDVIMARPPYDERGHQVVAVPNERYLWGEPSDAPYAVDIWVIGRSSAKMVWCTRITCSIPPGALGSDAQTIFWDEDGRSMMGVGWELFLPSAFSAPEAWRFVAGLPVDVALEPLRPFTTTFPAAVLLTCLVVALFGAREIRRRLIPLDRLIVAARSIAAGDYGARVDVSGGDEFEQLGSTFNDMSDQLAGVFSTLQALSEIDRMILADPELETVAGELLEHCTRLFRADFASVVLFQTDQGSANIFWKKPSTNPRRDIVDATDAAREIFARTASDRWIEAQELDEKFPGSVFVRGLHYFVVPMQHRSAVGGLCLGFAGNVEDVSLGHLRDFSDRLAVALDSLEARKLLYQQAHYDGLTGLPNRQLFMDRLRLAMDRAKRESTTGALMFVDLDRFKHVNDTEGHAIGDKVLIKTAERLRAVVRATDTVARLGGDEFTMILEGLHRPEDAGRVAEQIIREFEQGMVIEDTEHAISASIGIAVFPQEGRTEEQLLVNADLAMYRVKRTRPGSYGFYSEELNRELSERRRIENRLRVALRDDAFTLAYQPQLNWRTGEIWGVEALLRWTDPVIGEIGPTQFIPVAEDTGLIVELGEWVLYEGCRQFVEWNLNSHRLDRISFNISERQFSHPGFMALLERVVSDTGVDPGALQLELTETLLIKDTGATTQLFDALHGLGVGIALDDFGTGYSSLGYLRSLPFDAIKIDKSFVDDLESSADARSVVEAIVALAKALGKELIAEGVENAWQRDYLSQLGCDVGQGFLFSKALPPNELVKFLDRGEMFKAAAADGH